MLTEELITPDAIRSFSRFVIVTPEGELISEHEDTPSAVRALAAFTRRHPTETAAIYRRVRDGWMRY